MAQLPLIRQSLVRQLRASAFAGKTPVGPATTQAITEGVISQEREKAEDAARLESEEKLRIEDREQQQRQFDESQSLERERLRQQSKQFDIEQKRLGDVKQPGFFEGLLGS